MKRILFVLPLSVLLTYCSSTRPAIAPGVSNVQVNGSVVTDFSIAANNTRDWSYKASRDTSLKGSWQLEGMVAADGSWKTSEAWRPVDTTTTMVDTTAFQPEGSTVMPQSKSKLDLSNSPQTASSKKTFGAGMYDTSMHYFDTAAFRQQLADQVKPFEYWKRLPEINMMPTLGIFTGNTGCNLMNGSFNFSGNDIKFDSRIRTSKMACNEYDETTFVNALTKVDNYNVTNDMLELKQGNTTLLTFKRKVSEQ